jgi:hypothetical protein
LAAYGSVSRSNPHRVPSPDTVHHDHGRHADIIACQRSGRCLAGAWRVGACSVHGSGTGCRSRQDTGHDEPTSPGGEGRGG